MSGHSKWSTIKHKKAAIDAKRGQAFTKIIKEITVAAKIGGGDPEGNPRLRTAISKARDANMPMDNITRAVKKGTGELPGVNYEDLTYEGYGPAGVAVILDVVTDNKNRAAAEVRKLFSKGGGSIGESGSVSWMFERKGLIVASETDEDTLTEVVLDAGAEDISEHDGVFEVYTQPHDFENVKKAIEDAGISVQSADITLIPTNVVDVPKDKVEKVIAFLERLEEYDDAQELHSNANFEE